MIKGSNIISVCLLFSFIVTALAFNKTEDEASFFDKLKEELEEEYAPDIASLNNTWTSFLEARNELNETAAQTPWLEESSPGSGVYTFSLAGLAEFKSKVMDMVEQKNTYLAEKAQLRQEMAADLANRSIFYLQDMQGDVASVDGESQPLDLVRKVFGLDDESEKNTGDVESGDVGNNNADTSSNTEENSDDGDGNVEVTYVSGDSLIDSILEPSQHQDEDSGLSAETEEQIPTERTTTVGTTTKYPWAKWKNWRSNPWLKLKQASIQHKMQSSIEKRQKWQQFAMAKFAGHQASSNQEENEVRSDSVGNKLSTGEQAQDNFLNDIKDKLATQFAPAIQDLNDTRNEFLQAKEDIALGRSEKAWVKTSPLGFTLFDPQALFEFKSKIADMVVQKNKYIAERASLKQEMLIALRDLMMSRLLKVAESSESVSGPEFATSEAVDSIVEQMVQTGDDDVTEDILEGLPFANSLKLAAVSSGSSSDPAKATGGGEGSSSFVAAVFLGVLAVVGSVVLLAGLAMRYGRGRRRSTYIHMT